MLEVSYQLTPPNSKVHLQKGPQLGQSKAKACYPDVSVRDLSPEIAGPRQLSQ